VVLPGRSIERAGESSGLLAACLESPAARYPPIATLKTPQVIQ
jgi:hypothetical protein